MAKQQHLRQQQNKKHLKQRQRTSGRQNRFRNKKKIKSSFLQEFNHQGPTLISKVTNTNTLPSTEGDKCHPLLGYTYAVVAKWDRGEQIKITTQFDQNIQSVDSIRDETYIKISFKNEIKANMEVYWPIDSSSYISGSQVPQSLETDNNNNENNNNNYDNNNNNN